MANGQRWLDAGRRRRPAANPSQACSRLRLLECWLRSGRLALPCRAEIGCHHALKKQALSHLTAAGSRMQGYDVCGRLAEGCSEGCHDSEGGLGAQEVGKASAHL